MSGQQPAEIEDPDLDRTIEIVPYRHLWPRLYQGEEAEIRKALGPLAISIEHMGSTAVPGLAAKPVIDIHLTVPDSADEHAYRMRLEAAGYHFVHRAPGWFEHRLFKRLSPEVNLHVFTRNCAEVDRCRAFRDWLRQSAEDRDVYASVKRRLAGRKWGHVQEYADAKQTVIGEIMGRALAAAVEPKG